MDLGADKRNQERDEQERELTKENTIVFNAFRYDFQRSEKRL